VPSAFHWRTRSGVHTRGFFLGHDGNWAWEATFTATATSGRRTASVNALRSVARIRCLVDSEITRWPRTDALTFASSDSRHSRMRVLASSIWADIASTWRAWNLSNRSRPRCADLLFPGVAPLPHPGEAPIPLTPPSQTKPAHFQASA
jgi:hypothetical protein